MRFETSPFASSSRFTNYLRGVKVMKQSLFLSQGSRGTPPLNRQVLGILTPLILARGWRLHSHPQRRHVACESPWPSPQNWHRRRATVWRIPSVRQPRSGEGWRIRWDKDRQVKHQFSVNFERMGNASNGNDCMNESKSSRGAKINQMI